MLMEIRLIHLSLHHSMPNGDTFGILEMQLMQIQIRAPKISLNGKKI
jgi:hypothetical protein